MAPVPILDRENVNLGAIQRILGHEKGTATEIYLHSIGESEQEAIEKCNVFGDKTDINGIGRNKKDN